MGNTENVGRVLSIDISSINMGGVKKPPSDQPSLRAQQLRALPNGTMSRSFYLITTHRRLLRKIRPIEEKKLKPHEYRNSNNTVDLRFKCDWDELPYDAPIHRF